MSITDILDYEIRSSRWASYISNPYLQTLTGKYFAWKVQRKFRRYKASIEMADKLRNLSIDFT